MVTDIFYNGENVSNDYYEKVGKYYDIIQRVLSRTIRKKLSIMQNYGNGIILDQRFRITITQDPGSGLWDYIQDFCNSEEKIIRFEFGINDEKFDGGKLFFSVIPDRVEIESDGDEDKEATIGLIFQKKEFIISLVPDEKERA